MTRLFLDRVSDADIEPAVHCYVCCYAELVGGVARGKSGKDQCSFAFAEACGREDVSAQPCCLSAPERTGANGCPNRQAGGHWFGPSTAHCAKPLLLRGFRHLGQDKVRLRVGVLVTS